MTPNAAQSNRLRKPCNQPTGCTWQLTLTEKGEAISAHVKDYLVKRGVLKGKEVHRIVFYEVTRNAVLDSLSNPGEISENLVEAQQSRDALDQLVGFNLSPLLIRKLRTPHISAGRVQSPALRLIVERQREINQFTPVEFWTIGAELTKESSDGLNNFVAQLTYLSGKKLAKQEISNQEAADSAVASIEMELEQSERKLKVAKINRKDLKKRPPPPFKNLHICTECYTKIEKKCGRCDSNCPETL